MLSSANRNWHNWRCLCSISVCQKCMCASMHGATMAVLHLNGMQPCSCYQFYLFDKSRCLWWELLIPLGATNIPIKLMATWFLLHEISSLQKKCDYIIWLRKRGPFTTTGTSNQQISTCSQSLINSNNVINEAYHSKTGSALNKPVVHLCHHRCWHMTNSMSTSEEE